MSCYGDGLASETLSPTLIGGRTVIMSINSSPTLIDNTHTGTQVNFTLLNVNNQQPVSNVTLSITAFKDGKKIFNHIFKSDNGKFCINMIPELSGNTAVSEIDEIYSGVADQYKGRYDLKGSVFKDGGLYRFKIEIQSIDKYDNQVSKSYVAAISIPETKHYQIYDKKSGNQNVTIIAFYDKIGNFHYDSDTKSISFSIPFDWSETTIGRVSVIHQELKIPKSFDSFIATKYDTYVHGVKLNDNATIIDDYSSNERIIHLLVFKQDMVNILDKGNYSKPEMEFVLSPSNEPGFPVVQYTRNAQFKVSLSWDPPKIFPGSTTKFSFQIIDPYLANKTLDSMDYDFSIIAGKMGQVFHSSGKTGSNESMNIVNVKMPENYTGPMSIVFEKLNGDELAGSEFSGVVSNPPMIPEFPQGSLLAVTILFSVTVVFLKLSKYRI